MKKQLLILTIVCLATTNQHAMEFDQVEHTMKELTQQKTDKLKSQHQSRHESMRQEATPEEKVHVDKLGSFLNRDLTSSKKATNIINDQPNRILLILKPRAVCEIMQDIAFLMQNNISHDDLSNTINYLFIVLTNCDVTVCDYANMFSTHKISKFPDAADKLYNAYLKKYSEYKKELVRLKWQFDNLLKRNPF